jgi:hypothetical protein
MFLYWRKPQRIYNTELHFNLPNPDKNTINYERSISVITKKGIVYIVDIEWQTNSGTDSFMVLYAVKDGYIHSASINQGRRSDRMIKYLSSKFINLVHK